MQSAKKKSRCSATTFLPCSLFPLFFGNLLWLIYTLNIILNSDFSNVFLSIISFIKIFVAENVAKSPAG